MLLETERLILRPPTSADVPALFEFLGDPEAMKHTHADASLKECRRRILVHEWRRRRLGYAPWAIVTKANRQIIGWGGLYDDPFDPGWGVEVGYFFHWRAWGQGYASELTGACLDLADRVFEFSEITAFAHPENIASQRVLEKAGFNRIGFVEKMNRFRYRRERPVAAGQS